MPSTSTLQYSMQSAVEIRRIDADLLPPVRHAVLWPSVPLESQLLPSDHATTTIHYGAFLPDHGSRPVGCLTMTEEAYKKDLPPSVAAISPRNQFQVHKFAVYKEYQGQSVGSNLFRHTLAELGRQHDVPVLLHLDARLEQKGWYERFGLRALGDEVFIKNGPRGNGPAVEYIRLGIVLE